MSTRTWAAESAEDLFENLPVISWHAFSWLLRKGVPAPTLVSQLPRRARVEFHPEQPFFDFADDEGGTDALVFLAKDEAGHPADLVAWSTSPQRLAVHLGAAGILGEESMLRPRLSAKDALPVHRGPLGWLRAGCFGIIIVDTARAPILLRDFGPFATENVEHGCQLREMFRARTTTVLVPEERRAVS